jgi:TatD DNase family protein
VRLYDTHCHLHDREAFPDPEAALDRARAAGVARFNVVGVNPVDWDSALAFADRFDDVFAILGWHPNYTADYDPRTLPTLAKLLHHPKVVGIGEMGLDRHWTFAPFENQLAALADQLEVASDFALPMVFHVREAFADFLPILQSRGPDRYVIHCFSGTVAEILPLAELGCWFGADGPVTYRKNDDLRAAFASVPVGTWLLETDSPYMSPIPYRGKPNEPAYLPEILRAMALVASQSTEALAEVLWENSVSVFSRVPDASISG